MEDLVSNHSRKLEPAHIGLSMHPIWAPVALVAMALCLSAAYAITVKGASFWGPDVARMFDLTEEANVPTWFASSLWLFAAFLAFVIFRVHRDRGYPNARYWLGMAPLFLLLSIDEAGQIHETVGDMLGRVLYGYSILDFVFAWIFFGMTILISAGVLYFRFLFRLQRKFRLSFFISSGIFVTGTVVLESIGAAVWNGALEAFPLGQTWPRMILYEELLEMLGIILLIHTLLCIVALDESPYRAAV